MCVMWINFVSPQQIGSENIFTFYTTNKRDIIMQVNIIPDRKSAQIYCKRFSQQPKIQNKKKIHSRGRGDFCMRQCKKNGWPELRR